MDTLSVLRDNKLSMPIVKIPDLNFLNFVCSSASCFKKRKGQGLLGTERKRLDELRTE